MASITVNTTEGAKKVSIRWKGDNLAVHRLIVKRDDTGTIGLHPKKDNSIGWPWVITHIATGFYAGRCHSLEDAIKCAKLADCMFGQNTKEEIEENVDLKSFWRKTMNNNNGITSA
jgi:hypothetical protein